MSNYKSIHQVRNYSKRGGVSIYIYKSLNFKLRLDLIINSQDVESISKEILFNKERNTVKNVLHRHPKGAIEPFEKFLKQILKKKIKEWYDTNHKKAYKSNQKNGHSN